MFNKIKRKSMGLYKGIFWYIKNNICEDRLFVIKSECDSCGNFLDKSLILTSKCGINFNHKIEWSKLSKTITQGKPFDYYPRGRVEIINKRKKITAVVFFHPSLCAEVIKK